MRLIDVYNLEIQSGFPDQQLGGAKNQLWNQAPSPTGQIPKYAILSHRWLNGEITFEDFTSLPKAQLREIPPRNPVPSTIKSEQVHGSQSSIFKLAGACRNVRENKNGFAGDLRHAWIDTICINKSDPQETSTAINSMFRWYQNAEVCYVYLFDVTAYVPDFRQQFIRSAWFTRGWTLQELLAPKRLEFFDRDWNYIGSKADLVNDIATATGIKPEYLLGNFRSASLAQRMSWLANRTTKYIEDRAYCALGIFDVYLDTRYGQGEDEFLRLQEEIVKSRTKGIPFDESLFAWQAHQIEWSGLLAPAPGCFANAGDIIYEPSLARHRAFGQHEDIGIDAARQIKLAIPWYVPIPPTVMLITCGIPAWFTMVPKQTHEQHRKSRELQLNCWTRGSDGQLLARTIQMEQAPNKSWRRVHCGRVGSTSATKLYPPRSLAVSSATWITILDEAKYKS